MEKVFPDPLLKNQNWAYLWISCIKLTTVCFKVGTHLYMSLFPFVCRAPYLRNRTSSEHFGTYVKNDDICRAPYLRNSTSSEHFGTYVKNDDISRCSLLKKNIFGLLEGLKVQKFAQNKKQLIRHVPYLRNSVAHDHDFWYTCVKW